MIMENWREIIGYEGIYQVSNLGNVKSKRKTLKPVLCHNGYYSISLCQYGRHKNVYIHRLVTKQFLDDVDGKDSVNHIDGDKSNNCVENLEYATCSENIKHAFRIGLRLPTWGEKQGGSKLTADDVANIRKIRPNYTLRQIAEMYGVYPQHIDRIVKNERWQHLGMEVAKCQ
jgi:hypothetical protein